MYNIKRRNFQFDTRMEKGIIKSMLIANGRNLIETRPRPMKRVEFPYLRTDGRFCACFEKGKGTLLSSGFACEFPRTRRTDIFCSFGFCRRKEGRKQEKKGSCEGKPFEKPATSPQDIVADGP